MMTIKTIRQPSAPLEKRDGSTGIVRKPHGFTLVELLVVIAILSVLAGLLLPALEEAISAAHQVECSNQLRQINLGLLTYADSYDGYAFWGTNPSVGTGTGPRYFPGCGFTSMFQRGYNYWVRIMLYGECDTSRLWYGGAYGGDMRNSIFMCPSPSSIDPDETYPNDDKFISYTYNAYVTSHPFWTYKMHFNLASIDASKAFTFSCSASYGKNSYGETVGQPWRGVVNDSCFEPVDTAAYINWRAHSDGANAVFLDGHVKHYKRWVNLWTDY